jgi:lysophospholipase L1-like esterase
MIKNKNKNTLVIEKLILVLFGIVIAVLISELGLRVIKYLHVAILTADQKTLHEIDDAYEKKDGYQDKINRFPLMRFSCFLGYYPLESHRGKGYVSNKYGFRYSDDFPVRKPDGEIRIFITGGSVAWGWGVNQEDLYTTLAEKALQDSFPDKKIRVVSTGVVSYLSTHEKTLVLNKLKDFEPDIVVMFSGYNDIYAGYSGRRVVDDTWDYFDAAPILAKHNRCYALEDLNVKKGIYPPRYDDYIFKTHYIIDHFLYGLQSRKNLEASITKIQTDPNIILEDLEENIKTVFDASKRNKFNFVFYLQPSMFHTKKKLSPSEDSFKDSSQTWDVGFPEYSSSLFDLYRKQLPLFAQKEGIVFVDGDKAISHETKTVFLDQFHLGDRGNRLIAKHMVEILTDLLKTDKRMK